MASVRQEKTTVSMRSRECWHCEERIKKGEKYVTRQIRYDKTIISFYYHQICRSVQTF